MSKFNFERFKARLPSDLSEDGVLEDSALEKEYVANPQPPADETHEG